MTLKEGPLETYEAIVKESELMIVTFYRGEWCPFCTGWLKEWMVIPEFRNQLTSLKATFLAVSSEKQDAADRVLAKMGVDEKDERIRCIGDPTNEIVKELRREGLVNVIISGEPGAYRTHFHTYPQGMAQPGCLIMKMDDPVKTLYSWALVPKMRNLGGAVDRPVPEKIWEYAMNAMQSQPKEIDKPRGKGFRYFCSHFRRI